MQDRFKFRHWDKRINKMFYPERNDNFGYYVHNSDIIETMQCTGLKDKNGKLIYEGDIVRYKDEVYGLCIGRIEWDNAHYELQYYTGETYGWFSHILCFKHIKNIEVIGNIYENKELLNGNSL